MAIRQIPPIDTLRQLLDCDPDTGVAVWRERPASMFSGAKLSQQRAAKAWNAKNAGKIAFTALSVGYRVGRIFGKNCHAHRILFTLYNGRPPVGEVDHINGITLDNRSCNLRDATRSQNARNLGLAERGRVTGVNWSKADKCWRARIKVDGKEITLGQYKSFDDAVAARAKASEAYGFSKRHG